LSDRGSVDWGRAAIGAVIGGFVGYFVGIVLLRIVARLGSQEGWEDLIAIVLSMLSFGPIGAIVGALVGVRKDGRSLWARMSPRRRATTVIGAVIVAIGAGIWGATMDPMSAAFMAVWGLVIGGAVGYLLGRGGHQPDGDGLNETAGLVQPPVV
jgi:membrane protein YqaA with SNARE-associated domain